MQKAAVFLFSNLLIRYLLHSEAFLPDYTPRKTVNFEDANLKTFTEQRISNYSTLLLSEEHNLLFVGARDAIFALNIDNVSDSISQAIWAVPESKRNECMYKGKSRETDCRNYIRILQRLTETRMYVCGTNAFQPTCDYMVINNGKIELENKPEESKGQCPFDPIQRYASLMVDGEFYSATANNFLGTEYILLRSLQNNLRSENWISWLNDPNFIHLDVVQESESAGGDDDKIYLFFSETAVEFEFYNKLVVSRIARVCKGDRGGQRILQRKWTTFLKASLLCSSPDLKCPFNIIQDVFMLKTSNWRNNIFYAVFISQWGKQDISAICAFSMEKIQEVFNEGKYKSHVMVEQSEMKWVMYRGTVPSPRPGACINNNIRSNGFKSSLDLPDTTLQFVREHPLMDDVVTPINNEPKLIKEATKYTQIVVDRVVAANQKEYDIIFLGTDSGYLHKTLSLKTETFIIEQVQLFISAEPVENLQLSSQRGQLYIGSPSQVVQVPVAVCTQYVNCWDCVLARDPYCAWDKNTRHCIDISKKKTGVLNLIQNIENGDPSECSTHEELKTEIRNIIPGNSLVLDCQSTSNLAHIQWLRNTSVIPATNTKYLYFTGGLLIFNVSVADEGQYDCRSVETVAGKSFGQVTARYLLHSVHRSHMGQQPIPTEALTDDKPAISIVPISAGNNVRVGNLSMTRSYLQTEFTLKGFLVLFVMMFILLLAWNLYKGHVPLPLRPSRNGNTRRMPTALPSNSVQQLEEKPPSPKPPQLEAAVSNVDLPLTAVVSEGSVEKNSNNNSIPLENANSSSARPLFVLDELEYIDADHTESKA
ncbi:semaphorin-4E-like isoform X1 [Chiloscyllium plagiosum]|uniref:semaphorin-4E-like isoform X1 n=3 Tax=Chiloscyllium plagiosum TaxID=36176 RepID=UPI001CB7B21E|nr:semaphorin-4E-like isoform X1 [Chiloscyllium plagiosum]XP_043577325.1 semaphorin-4E-like isoform X1 [Chiloscyllium plagiosum]XP_043577326.1 semaphorin-4E-like isoform X1 [Chiloscyllium plagiosum]